MTSASASISLRYVESEPAKDLSGFPLARPPQRRTRWSPSSPESRRQDLVGVAGHRIAGLTLTGENDGTSVAVDDARAAVLGGIGPIALGLDGLLLMDFRTGGAWTWLLRTCQAEIYAVCGVIWLT